MTQSTDTYTSEQIQVLEGLEAIRKRPGMYVGGTGLSALHHLVYECVDNAIDEVMADFATNITVRISVDGSCSSERCFKTRYMCAAIGIHNIVAKRQ